MNDDAPFQARLRTIRIALWVLVAVALAATAAIFLIPSASTDQRPARASLGGPFTLVGADGKPFSSERLHGRPYAIYFGFTRCGDVCPTTLARLAKLRNQLGGTDKFDILFVTIDPANDGPAEVGQYATLFDTPIIGLTGSPAQIDRVKKQYGIFAQPSAHPMPGREMDHSAMVLLFGRDGSFVGTISPDEPDAAALRKLKQAAG